MEQWDTYGKRLAHALEVARKDRAALAEHLKISVQAIGAVLNGKSSAFTAENSAKAARWLRVDHYWLATGEGEPRPPGLSEEAVSFAQRYDRLDEEGRAKFSAAIVIARTGVPDQVVEDKMPVTRKARERAEHKD
jgi:transcriptional regulator with XRE-family HTH domain